MSLPQKKNEYFTYADYYSWETEERYELIDGVAYLMSAPSMKHQRVLRKLAMKIGNYLEGKKCEMFFAPFDVRLNFDTKDNTVVQPDLLVVCDNSQLDDKGCKGAPDFIIEILSPSSGQMDIAIKLGKYLQAEVKEYWVVNPENGTIIVHILDQQKYITSIYGAKSVIPITVLENCQVDFAEILESTQDGE